MLDNKDYGSGVSKGFLGKFSVAFCASLVPSLTLFVFGPLYIYFTNIQEWPFLISEVWYYLVAIAVASSIILTLLVVFFKPAIFRLAVVIIFVFGFLLWFQGNILVWDYGVLDGKQINWNEYTVRGYIDALVWITFFVIAYWKRYWICKNMKYLILTLIIIQCINLIIAFYQSPQEPNWKKYTTDKQQQFSFSKQRNVIILVLDSFQSDIFEELINENPGWKSDFSGFTYFRNATGGFPTTYPSIPLILTGEYYDNSKPIKEYLKDIYATKCIPLTLKNDGYRVELYGANSPIEFCPNDVKKVFNTSNCQFSEIQGLISVALFRESPQIAKKSLHDLVCRSILDSDSKSNLDFVRDISQRSNAGIEQPVFKLFHVYGAHPPFRLNENLEIVPVRYDRAGYKAQTGGAIKLARTLLDALKKIGAYDNSLIFVIGDHGAGFPGSYNVRKEFNNNVQMALTSASEKIIATGTPLILTKPFHTRGGMKVSDAPVSISDIPKTIVSELGISETYSGCSLFEVEPLESRKRRFLYYEWQHDYWDKDYLPEMEEYYVDGFSWERHSWKPSYRIFSPGNVQIKKITAYKYGQDIVFGETGNASYYQWDGWSFPEKGHTWTNGRSASLVFEVEEPKTDLILKATLLPYTAQNVNHQRVDIYINGTKVDKWLVNKAGDYTTIIPKELVNYSALRILFNLPDAISPRELNVNTDQRQLALAMQRLVILQPPIYDYHSEIRFGKGGNAYNYQIEGWSEPEEGFTWSNGNMASIFIPIRTSDADLMLNFRIFPFVSDKLKQQDINILVNKQKLGDLKIKAEGEYEIKIPNKYITGSSLLIQFEFPNACSPAQLGVNEDTRKLGVAFKWISICQ